MKKSEEKIIELLNQYPDQDRTFISMRLGMNINYVPRILRGMVDKSLIYARRSGHKWLYSTTPPAGKPIRRTYSEEMEIRRAAIKEFGQLPIVF